MKSIQIQIFSPAFFALFATLFVASVLPARAQFQPASALVHAVHGSATCSIDGNWQPLKENTTLTTGAMIKTAPGATLDLFLPASRTVLRLMPDSVLRFDCLNKMPAGDVGVTVTKLSLLAGTVIGSQNKLASPSEFEIKLPDGLAKIVGTEYSIVADGTVACLRGTVSVVYNPPGKGSPVNVSVPSGFSSNPATDKTAATSAAYLQNIAPDIQAVRNNDAVFNAHRITLPVQDISCQPISPTHGNHGDDHNRGDGHHYGNDHGDRDGHN
jgi:hypothetical protein